MALELPQNHRPSTCEKEGTSQDPEAQCYGDAGEPTAALSLRLGIHRKPSMSRELVCGSAARLVWW